ncbi:MAG: SpvB/TcaC N-terminal domain-containing protein, partial [Myxococcota bacterium]
MKFQLLLNITFGTLLTLLLSSAHAQQTASQGSALTQASASGGGGSSIGVNQGRAHIAIPIEAEPSRLGTTDPQLALVHSSQNRDNGPLGVGWRIAIPWIEPNDRGGFRFRDGDRFCDLVELPGHPDSYRCAVEAEGFRSFHREELLGPNGLAVVWTMYDSEGTLFRFALSHMNAANSEVLKTYLTDVVDSSDNWLHYTYRDLTLPHHSSCDSDGQAGCTTSPYASHQRFTTEILGPAGLKAIRWNNRTTPDRDRADLDGAFGDFASRITLHYEARPDRYPAVSSQRSLASTLVSNVQVRLARIDSVKSYVLGYGEENDSQRSIL